MDKANLPITSASTLLELLGNGRLYRVPPYQRDYSWTEEQWEDLWADIAELVGRPDETHYMGALVVEANSDRERERVKTGPDVFALLEALERRAEVFAALFDPQHAYWIERRDSAPRVRDLGALRVRQMTPLVFAAWERLDEADFARVLKLLVVVLFRYSAVSGLNTNVLESVFHGAAKGLLEARLRTPADVFGELRQVYVDDARFEQDFARLAPDPARQGKKPLPDQQPAARRNRRGMHPGPAGCTPAAHRQTCRPPVAG